MQRNCTVCLKEYTITGSGDKFCSETCKLKKHEQICGTCGKSFQNLNKRKFCSLSCSSKRVRKPNANIKNCLLCGKEFKTNYSTAKKYCSKKCSSTVNSGPNHAAKICGSKRGQSKANTIWDILPSVRSRILKRMKLPCSVCGYDKTVGDLHHIHGRKIDNCHAQENLCYLCPNCHREAGQKLILEANLIPFSIQVGMKWKEFYSGNY